jgi:hypothetical protein
MAPTSANIQQEIFLVSPDWDLVHIFIYIFEAENIRRRTFSGFSHFSRDDTPES